MFHEPDELEENSFSQSESSDSSAEFDGIL